MRRSPSILDSFNFAFEGIIHVPRTQRNMRVHLAAVIAALVGAVWVGVSKLELIALLLAIAFVFIAEMINSALEQAIDVATTSFDPLAKLAKDVAAGAVLIPRSTRSQSVTSSSPGQSPTGALVCSTKSATRRPT